MFGLNWTYKTAGILAKTLVFDLVTCFGLHIDWSVKSRSSPFRKTSLAADVEIKKHVQTYTYNHADWPQSGVTA